MDDSLSGSRLKITVTLEVEAGSSKKEDEDTLTYTVKEAEEEDAADQPSTDDAQLNEAFNSAYARVEEAINAVNGLISEGIDATGLPDLLDKAAFLLEHGTNLQDYVG